MRILVGVFFFFSMFSSAAQDGEGIRRIEAARIALITERLELGPEQAEKFWPLYREFTSQRESLRRELLATKIAAGDNNLSEEEGKKLIQKALEVKERQLKLDKEYTEKFSQVLSTRQLLELRKAEEDFRQMLLERLQRRRALRDRRNGSSEEN
jgi:hypothetical protein